MAQNASYKTTSKFKRSSHTFLKNISKGNIQSKKILSMERIFLIIIVLIVINSQPVFAQVHSSITTPPLITTNVDKRSHNDGDILTIYGAVRSVVPQTPLTIQILDPNNNLVQIAQIDVSADGKYVYTTMTTGTLWKTDGTYTVKVQYGPPNVTAQATFSYEKSPVLFSGFSYVKDLNSQQTFEVNYTINGGTIENMTIDPQNLSLFVHMNSTENGLVTFLIPRVLIDAETSSGQDEPFIVLIDGNEVNPQDSGSDNTHRKISIQFLQGDQVIQIIGTKIIPEFGPLIPVVFAISVTTLIVIQYKIQSRKL